MKTTSSPKNQFVRLLVILALAFGALGLPTGSARATAIIIVNSPNDPGDGICDLAECTLREAIAQAGTGNIIHFDNDYTILLSKNGLLIDKNLTIDGTSHSVTVSGDTDGDGTGDVQVFYVNSGVTFNLNNLAVSKGYSSSNGGGIYNNGGTIIIANSTFSANSSGADGGGIYDNGGSLTITNNTFFGNSATRGGGLYSNSGTTTTIANSTFSANSAGAYSGGIYNEGIATIANSTISGNSAPFAGGLRSLIGSLSLQNSIVANNSGGNCYGGITNGGSNLEWGNNSCPITNADPKLSALGNYGGPTQTFALLPGSAAIDAGDPVTCAADPVNALDQRGISRPSACDIGAFESGGFTLAISSGNSQSAVISDAFTVPLQVSVTPLSIGEPVEGGTVNFLPPATGASAVLTGNPAVISGGHAQVTAVANDIPAGYFLNANTHGATTGVNFLLYNTCSANLITVTNSNDDGPGSLRWAIGHICPGELVTFAGNDTIHLARTLTIDKDLMIDGAGHTVTVSGDTNGDGSGDVQVFSVQTGVTFHLNNLEVSKGHAVSSGGGILNNGTLTINNSTFSGNSASTFGGGIFSLGTLTISNSTFTANSADRGGGIENYQGVLTVTKSTFSDNTVQLYGGGIENALGTLIISNSTFSCNSGTENGFGGGIINFDTTTVSNSTFSGNSVNYYGGGIANYSGALTLRNTIIANSLSGGNCYGTITNGGNNLEDGITCGWGSDLGSMSNTNPLLGPLANNGGPTQTFALLPGSPAIDAGDDDICMAAVGDPDYGAGGLDQRGVTRLHGSHCDIGAFELDRFSIFLPLVKR